MIRRAMGAGNAPLEFQKTSAGELYPGRNPYSAPMAAKMRSDAGKQAYRKREWIAEPPDGWIKSVLGFRQFSLRAAPGSKRSGSSFAWR